MNLTRNDNLKRPKKRHLWTERELAQFRNLYPENANTTLAEMFGVSLRSIENKANFLGLKKTKEYLSKIGEKRSSHPNIVATRFKKGHKPFNKGIKQEIWMNSDKIERSKETRFKKGNTPANIKTLGTETIRGDGFVYVKTPKGWIQKQILIWENVRGKVPAGMRVIFLDGNKKNFAIDNLMLVNASQAASVYINRLSPEKRTMMWQKAQLSRNLTIERDKRRIRWGFDPLTKLVKKYHRYDPKIV